MLPYDFEYNFNILCNRLDETPELIDWYIEYKIFLDRYSAKNDISSSEYRNHDSYETELKCFLEGKPAEMNTYIQELHSTIQHAGQRFTFYNSRGSKGLLSLMLLHKVAYLDICKNSISHEVFDKFKPYLKLDHLVDLRARDSLPADFFFIFQRCKFQHLEIGSEALTIQHIRDINSLLKNVTKLTLMGPFNNYINDYIEIPDTVKSLKIMYMKNQAEIGNIITALHPLHEFGVHECKLTIQQENLLREYLSSGKCNSFSCSYSNFDAVDYTSGEIGKIEYINSIIKTAKVEAISILFQQFNCQLVVGNKYIEELTATYLPEQDLVSIIGSKYLKRLRLHRLEMTESVADAINKCNLLEIYIGNQKMNLPRLNDNKNRFQRDLVDLFILYKALPLLKLPIGLQCEIFKTACVGSRIRKWKQLYDRFGSGILECQFDLAELSSNAIVAIRH
ncbi:hypothetical protein HDV06_003577 [Boothiomyces sp. JEL0866]|nr:hypothetical protein HDV06_003577 [Boothiomyces sp. JEL0866]